MHNQDLQSLHSSPVVTRVTKIKLAEMRKRGVLSGNYMKCIQFFRWKIQAEETTCETKVNIETSANERAYESVNWIQLAQYNSTVV